MASHSVPGTRIIQLARTISTSVAKIDAALAANGLPSPSFDEDAPASYLPPEIWSAQDAILDATAELHDLLLEPLHLIKKHSGVSKRLARPDGHMKGYLWVYEPICGDFIVRPTTQYASKPFLDTASQILSLWEATSHFQSWASRQAWESR